LLLLKTQRFADARNWTVLRDLAYENVRNGVLNYAAEVTAK
jgi:hypothetical protein